MVKGRRRKSSVSLVARRKKNTPEEYGSVLLLCSQKQLQKVFCCEVAIHSLDFPSKKGASCALWRPFSSFVNKPVAVCSNSALVLASLSQGVEKG